MIRDKKDQNEEGRKEDSEGGHETTQQIGYLIAHKSGFNQNGTGSAKGLIMITISKATMNDKKMTLLAATLLPAWLLSNIPFSFIQQYLSEDLFG